MQNKIISFIVNLIKKFDFLKIISAVVFFLGGLAFLSTPKFYSTKFSSVVDLSGYNYLISAMFWFFAIYLVATCTKKTKGITMICPKCELAFKCSHPIGASKTYQYYCKSCDTELVNLDGFYEQSSNQEDQI